MATEPPIMKIYLQQKRPGRARQTIAPCPIDLTAGLNTTGALISSLVRIMVSAYNDRIDNVPADPDADRQANPIAEDQIENLAEAGRVAFGLICNSKKEDPEKAIANALQCHEDGIFKMFLNGSQLGPNESRIEITDGDTLTIVRLTMLSGRMW